MKILQAHNYYQIAGGEDTVVAIEKKMLEENGHHVVTYYRRNEEINELSKVQKLRLLKKTVWSKDTYEEFSKILKKEKPAVCHVHNFLPLISPSIFDACQDAGVPVVQTLHNYRLICTSGLFLREGKVCEDCLGKSAYGAVMKKCYRNSALQTFAVANMIEKNKKANTWNTKVDAYICLTEFAKQKFVKHGLPAAKIKVKPNFLNSHENLKNKEVEPYFVFVGRLIESKGAHLLGEIAHKSKWPIKMVGEGELKDALSDINQLELMGKKPYAETLELIQNAAGLILPSLCYEGMPMTILEAFSLQTLVITSDLGAMQSMVSHKENGLLFAAGNTTDLLDKLNFVVDNPEKVKVMKMRAFNDFDKSYSAEANYKILMGIYSNLIEEKKV